MTDFNIGSFGILEDNEYDDLWESLFEPWGEKCTYLSFQSTDSEIIHFMMIIKWNGFCKITVSHGHSARGERVFHLENE